jgi:hypothetical protein
MLSQSRRTVYYFVCVLSFFSLIFIDEIFFRNAFRISFKNALAFFYLLLFNFQGPTRSVSGSLALCLPLFLPRSLSGFGLLWGSFNSISYYNCFVNTFYKCFCYYVYVNVTIQQGQGFKRLLKASNKLTERFLDVERKLLILA